MRRPHLVLAVWLPLWLIVLGLFVWLAVWLVVIAWWAFFWLILAVAHLVGRAAHRD